TLGGNLPDLSCRAGWAIDFTSTATPALASAEIVNPPNGATLTSANQIFNWTTGVGVSSYQLAVGTSPGANDIYSGPAVTDLATLVTGLPTTSSTVYVRLSSFVNGGWHFVDYTYLGAGTTTAVGTFAVGRVLFDDGYSARQTPPFSTSAGDLVVALVGSSGPDLDTETQTVSGGGLAWSLASRVNGQHGVAEIWSARSPNALSNITVTATPTLANPYESLVVI